jgi:hypothetical protein
MSCGVVLKILACKPHLHGCNTTDTTEVLLWLRDLKIGPWGHVTALLPTPKYQGVKWLDKEKEAKCPIFLPCGYHLPTMG